MEQEEIGPRTPPRTLADEGIEVSRDIDPGISYEIELRCHLIVTTIFSIIIIIIIAIFSTITSIHDTPKPALSDGAVKSASLKSMNPGCPRSSGTRETESESPVIDVSLNLDYFVNTYLLSINLPLNSLLALYSILHLTLTPTQTHLECPPTDALTKAPLTIPYSITDTNVSYSLFQVSESIGLQPINDHV